MEHLDQVALARRWGLSPRTLEQWRWRGCGPRFLRLGGRVRYPLEDVEAFEKGSLCASTAGPINTGTDGRRANDLR